MIKQFSTLVPIFLATLLAGSDVLAQSGSSSAAVSRQQGAIRNQAIGQGYTIDSINNVSLAGVRAFTPTNPGSNVNSRLAGRQGPAQSRAASFGSVRRAPANKPFSSIRQRPTVSPFLNLFREGEDVNVVNFNTLVQPQLQQQAFNRQLQQQQQQINRRFQQMSAQAAFNPQGSQSQLPTGHSTTFNNLSRFYPSAQR